jgi:hypothetical protein
VRNLVLALPLFSATLLSIAAGAVPIEATQDPCEWYARGPSIFFDYLPRAKFIERAQTEFSRQATPDERFSFGMVFWINKSLDVDLPQIKRAVTEVLAFSRMYRKNSRSYKTFSPEEKKIVRKAQSILDQCFPILLGQSFPFRLKKTVFLTSDKLVEWADHTRLRAVLSATRLSQPVEAIRDLVHSHISLASRSFDAASMTPNNLIADGMTEWFSERCFDLTSRQSGIRSTDFKGSPTFRQWAKNLELSLRNLLPNEGIELLKHFYKTGYPDALQMRLRQSFGSLGGAAKAAQKFPYSSNLQIYLEELERFARLE